MNKGSDNIAVLTPAITAIEPDNQPSHKEAHHEQ